MLTRPRTDFAIAGVALAFSGAAFALTTRFDEVPVALMSGLGAELFPRLVIGSMALFAGLIGLGIGGAPTPAPAALPPMLWKTGATLLAFMGGVELIGLWPSAFLFVVGLGRLWGEPSLGKLAAAAAGLCLALYLLFVRFLGGTFPKGVVAGLWS